MKRARWIQKATRRRGALHRHLGIPVGQPIPLTLLEYTAAHGENETIRKEARLALTLRGLGRVKKKRRTRRP